MSFLSFLFGRNTRSASVAKQRLQAVLAAERASQAPRRPEYLPALQRELMGVVAKYVKIQSKDVRISYERDRHQAEVLKVKIVLQHAARS
jgi:cell division topological specificity factor